VRAVAIAASAALCGITSRVALSNKTCARVEATKKQNRPLQG
jgi:hypothetical protein